MLDMDNLILNYDEWLRSHSKRKTMMEKLERSLVPFEVFEAIQMRNDKQPRSGKVTIGENTYDYVINYDHQCIGNDVYNAQLSVITLKDKWNNVLMGYNKFKLVMEDQRIKTIYSDHEDFFYRIIEMFEGNDWTGLYANRSTYINNLLARYILLRLLEVHRPELSLLQSIRTKEDGIVTVLGTDVNRSEWIMYAFSKRDAIKLAQRLDGCCKHLTIIYFFNQDFEKDGNVIGYDSGCTQIVSARAFMLSLNIDSIEKRLIEKQMLMLVSLLYNEHLEWNWNRIERVAINPPFYGKRMEEQKVALKKYKKVHAKKRTSPKPRLPWYEKIPRTLLEDALNVLHDTPKTHIDIFHFLCAANLVNAYMNQCKHNVNFSIKQVNRMFQAKQQIFKCLISLAEEHNPHVEISLSKLPAILVNMKVEGRDFQISFRGMTNYIVERIIETGVASNGKFKGLYLQPIATALYQYSYLLRWKGLN